MAIQIWRDGQYHSVDLAQYGESGQLTGAYIWRDGAWRTLWKRSTGGGDFTWSDDFTTPELHERWQLLAGEYLPPGLTDAGLLGPDLGSSFEVTVDATLNGGTILMPIMDDQFNAAASIQIDAYTVRFPELDTDADFPGMPITLRRADGMWSVLANGEVLVGYLGDPLTMPDTHTGPAHIAIQAQGATVTLIGYTNLA